LNDSQRIDATVQSFTPTVDCVGGDGDWISGDAVIPFATAPDLCVLV